MTDYNTVITLLHVVELSANILLCRQGTVVSNLMHMQVDVAVYTALVSMSLGMDVTEVKHKFGGCFDCLHSLLWRLALLSTLCCFLCRAQHPSTCIRTAPARLPLSIMTKDTGELVQGVASSEGAKHEVNLVTSAMMLAGRVAYDLGSCAQQVLHPLKLDAVCYSDAIAVDAVHTL